MFHEATYPRFLPQLLGPSPAAPSHHKMGGRRRFMTQPGARPRPAFSALTPQHRSVASRSLRPPGCTGPHSWRPGVCAHSAGPSPASPSLIRRRSEPVTRQEQRRLRWNRLRRATQLRQRRRPCGTTIRESPDLALAGLQLPEPASECCPRLGQEPLVASCPRLSEVALGSSKPGSECRCDPGVWRSQNRATASRDVYHFDEHLTASNRSRLPSDSRMPRVIHPTTVCGWTGRPARPCGRMRATSAGDRSCSSSSLEGLARIRYLTAIHDCSQGPQRPMNPHVPAGRYLICLASQTFSSEVTVAESVQAQVAERLLDFHQPIQPIAETAERVSHEIIRSIRQRPTPNPLPSSVKRLANISVTPSRRNKTRSSSESCPRFPW